VVPKQFGEAAGRSWPSRDRHRGLPLAGFDPRSGIFYKPSACAKRTKGVNAGIQIGQYCQLQPVRWPLGQVFEEPGGFWIRGMVVL